MIRYNFVGFSQFFHHAVLIVIGLALALLGLCNIGTRNALNISISQGHVKLDRVPMADLAASGWANAIVFFGYMAIIVAASVSNAPTKCSMVFLKYARYAGSCPQIDFSAVCYCPRLAS